MTAAFKKRNIDVERITTAAAASLQTEAPSVASVGDVLEIPLSHLTENPANARAWYPIKSLLPLAESLKASGQLTAVSAFFDSNNVLTLIDGHRRLKASALAGLPTIRVEVRKAPLTSQELYLRSRDANLHQSSQTLLDDAVIWKKLIDEKVFKHQRALAITLGITDSEVSRTLSLSKIPSAILEKISEHPPLQGLKPLNAIREFFEVCGEAETHALVDEAIRDGLGYREIEARRVAKSTPREKATRARSISRAILFGNANGSVRLLDNGSRLELSIKGLDPESSKELSRRLEQLFPSPV